MKLLYTNRQLAEIGLEPARQMQEAAQLVHAVSFSRPWRSPTRPAGPHPGQSAGRVRGRWAEEWAASRSAVCVGVIHVDQ